MASYRKLASSWQCRVRYQLDDGSWKELSKSGFKTKKEAQIYAQKIEFRSTDEIIGGKMNLESYLLEWFDVYIKGKRKLNTEKTYLHAIKKHIVPELGLLSLKDLKPMKYQKFIDSKLEEGLSVETARRIHTPMRMALEQAVMNGYLDKNPVAHVKIRKREATKLKYLDPELIPKVLEFLYARDYGQGIFFECLFESGMRKGECAAVEFDDVSFKDNTIRIDNSYDYNATKKESKMNGLKNESSERTIVMREEFMSKLKTYMKYRMEKRTLVGAMYNKENNFVFGRDDGTPFPKSTLYNAFSAAIEHVDYDKLPIHSTRHTHAVMLLEANVMMKEVQERLGHKSIQITSDIYSHVTRKMENVSIAKFDEYMKTKQS